MKRTKWCKYCNDDKKCGWQNINKLCFQAEGGFFVRSIKQIQDYRDWLAKEIRKQNNICKIYNVEHPDEFKFFYNSFILETLLNCAKQLRSKP